MRPILLKGHERPLSQVKFNRDGDLLFSVSKDSVASIWYSSNGERLGTLNGHSGAISAIDIDPTTTFAITGSADFSAKLWRVETGECIFTWNTVTPVRGVEFNKDASKVLVLTAEVMGHPGTISIYPVDFTKEEQSTEPLLVIKRQPELGVFTVAGWSYGDKYIIAGHNDGSISKIDAETGEFLETAKYHEGIVTDLQFSPDRTYFITSSKDQSAVLVDVLEFKLLKQYQAKAPVNSAVITPVKDYIILGGGQDAKDVTTTKSADGKFESKIFHKIFKDEIGRIKGHFGPINTIAIHPKGTGFASGGEDGYVRLHHFDQPYFDFQYDVEKTAAATNKASLQTAS
ncbi:Translation initiation factor 3 subunit i [Komagataella phaffii CBS 7435]|uniref:Eukaryotic translation initiation factor 3 subunit I n=2 Tax=Komagataella phaffii TaxID=460519 RepID=C4QVS4_KOMPG|nr:Subunit of the core complex of translation initiation factor (eIF3) [Komagataella phaffii GS115]AOA61275.1 GQ67_02547T0 [Komagataella phaffii]KAI0465244.1 hypothetical protein LJB42_000471 [Komagataella kurtzmanii]CAH2446004.1 Translation initiation factor 3 subunit i [Komagataella phaffii CBS 7435]AOA66447.1 GQ68_02701T0 [Komagataella phaffii GS115]CAY67347.1 Subunit of the core complex of translation initiation factor (eIF3) [Komagataella phaffii GS115]